MKTILISVDMEGISGVVAMDHVRPEHKEYERFRKLMTAEANAAIEGAREGGATRIVVNDSHAGMTNLLIEELNPAAELISGSPKPLEMMQGIGPDVDAVFLIGYHFTFHVSRFTFHASRLTFHASRFTQWTSAPSNPSPLKTRCAARTWTTR